ncbi:MAG: large subunit ribosomal protein [Thermoleophilaceae bacterium]|jgi:large subunit ribosomal protein L25|nr:large subunit ribosomal protein [Thermoleophilaceae bacterium]
MLEIEARETGGTSTARAVRRTGKIPGVLYGNGREPFVFAVESRHLRATLAAAGGRHAVIEVKVPGAGTPIHAFIKDIQLHPLRDTLTHFDLLEVRMDRKIQATVSILFVGEAEGVKTFGGILAQNAHELTIEALPGDLPEHVEIDISELNIGDSIKLSDLPETKGLIYIGDPDTMLASVAQPKGPTAEEEAAEAEAEAASEAAEARAEAAEGDDEGDSGSSSDSDSE